MHEDYMDYLTMIILAAALCLGLLHYFDALFY